jgi:hypothetical protein
MKIKKTILKHLLKEIVYETFNVLNEGISGEWWIMPGGTSIFADGDIGDSNHEAHVIDQVSNEIYENFLGDSPYEMGYLIQFSDEIKDALLSDDRLSDKELKEWDDPIKRQEILLNKIMEDGLYTNLEQAKMAISIAYNEGPTDARDYAMKYLGWKRMTSSRSHTTIQTWFLKDSDLNDIKNGIYDALGEDLDDDSDDNSDENNSHTVEIEVRASNRFFDEIPLSILNKASVKDLIKYMKRLAWMREEYYTDYGHSDPSSKLWIWDGEKLKTVSTKKYSDHAYWPAANHRDITHQGRYDPIKKVITVSDLTGFGQMFGHGSDLPLTEIPTELDKILKDEFGNDATIKLFETYKDRDFYINFGHEHHPLNIENDVLWVWKNDQIKTVPRKKYKFHSDWLINDPTIKRAEYTGRYDSKNNVVSVAIMRHFDSGEEVGEYCVPEDVIRALKFEFGDNVKIKAFC